MRVAACNALNRDTKAVPRGLVKKMNIDPGLAAGYVIVAVGGFALGALAGRWMMTEVSAALAAVQMRLSALEQKVIGGITTAMAPATNGNASVSAAAAHPAVAPSAAPMAAMAAPTAASAAAAQAAALEHHASAVEKLAAAIDKHAQAVDDHGAATVAAAVELGSHPATAAPALPAATFAAPAHAAAVTMGAAVTPVAASAIATAPQG